MAETSLNERRSLSTADTANVDLHVENGTITDGSGNPVVIGEIHNETEQSFGKADAGVTEVKGATPTGDLQVNSNGEIVVNGYGAVTLVGPRREVSTIGGNNGEAASIDVDANGNLSITYSEWNFARTRDKNDTPSNTGSYQFGSFSVDKGIDQRDLNAHASLKVDGSYSDKEYTVDLYGESDDTGASDTIDRTTTDDVGGASFSTYLEDVDNENTVITVKPFDDDDGDGTAEYVSGPAYEDGDVTLDYVAGEITYDYEEEVTTTVSAF